jgi:hypothetical protein
MACPEKENICHPLFSGFNPGTFGLLFVTVGISYLYVDWHPCIEYRSQWAFCRFPAIQDDL